MVACPTGITKAAALRLKSSGSNAVPDSVKRTLISLPEATERLTSTGVAPAFSPADWLAWLNCTVGGSSSSVTVAVWTVVAPSVALVGASMVAMIVSSSSSVTSSLIWKVRVVVVSPASTTTGFDLRL